MKTSISRREFIKKSTIAATGMVVLPNSTTILNAGNVIGANDRIRIGIIGCGTRGNQVYMNGIYKHAKALNAEVVAVCDPWRISREQTNARVKEYYGREAKQFVSYRDLLEMKDLDAVMIASPDHLHTKHLEAAAMAGKHIYVEKPLAMEMDKLVSSVDAVKEAGVVVQVGTQLRSLPGIVGARNAFMSGAIGELSRIEECRNSAKPYWYEYIRDVKEEDVDWQEFLDDRAYRPFDPKLYSAWYGYYEFSHGPIPNLGAHFIDLVHFITGVGFPESCVCLGGTYTWKDEHNFTAPDCIQATWTYPEGFIVSSSNNLGNGKGNVRNFYGDKGMIGLTNWNQPFINSEGSPYGDNTLKGDRPIEHVDANDHYYNWLHCIRNNEETIAPIDAGYQHAVAVLMAMKSYETGKKVTYDPINRELLV